MDLESLNAALCEMPLYRYEFFDVADLTFTDRVRVVCESECPMYGKTWACPPAVGTPEECRERVFKYDKGLLISTITEVSDIANMEETLATRGDHEAITREVHALLKAQTDDILVLSTEACAACAKCSYPDGPCRRPDRMYPCVESHCILVTDLAEKLDIDFLAGGNIVTWFSLFLYHSEG